ncbi:MAG: ABC transporter ATP-binding protein [Syntrophomonadaceae bacterium]|nr:ABC transporter ATP-binding protein [Syntrophomonadaceae bacterium]
MGTARPLVEVIQLKKTFRSGLFNQKEKIVAIDGVSLSIYPRQIFGLIGESGCGKTTLAKTMLALLRPTEGEVRYEGRNIFAYDERQLGEFRSQVQMIFQDPYGSLNPKIMVKDALAEVLFRHKQINKKKDAAEIIFELLEQVGLNKSHAECFPHELSGGQKQRVALTRALAVGPRVLICDEPVSALDMIHQNQIAGLLQHLQQRKELTLLLISHNMMFVKGLTSITAVMYKGKIVEIAPTSDLFEEPLHPYTKMLFACMPKINDSTDALLPPGNARHVSSLKLLGCCFVASCSFNLKICTEAGPNLKAVNDNRWVACHLYSS